MSTVILMGQVPANQEVKAQKFSLQDARGKTRAMLFSRNSQAMLVLADQDQEPRLTLVVAADGTPTLDLSDNGDKVRARLSVNKEGSSQLGLYAKEGNRPRALFTVSGADGSPRLGLTDGNQLLRIAIGAAGEEWAVGVWDSKGKLVGSVGDKK
jgi:hypothetical protein